MNLDAWLKKHPRPKHAALVQQLRSWLDENVPDDEGLAKLTAQDHKQWLAKLEHVRMILHREGKAKPPGTAVRSTRPAVVRPPAMARYVGQSELGPPELAEQVPPFPYWEEMLRLASKRLPDSRLVRPTGALSIDETSVRDLARGTAGSAFAGLIQIAGRTGESIDRMFLVPMYQEDAQQRAIRYQRTRASYRTTGQKLLSPHASALQQLIAKHTLAGTRWNGFDAVALHAEQTHHETGCFLGFFLVKGETAGIVGAYVNFTCASLNRYATGEYDAENPPALSRPGGPELPLRFAQRAYEALGKLL